MSAVSLRFIEKKDVDEAVRVESAANQYQDEDFLVDVLPRYSWGKEDLMEAVRQYQSRSKFTNDTRVLVAETMSEGRNKVGQVEKKVSVAGTLAYETREDGYEVLLMSTGDDEVRMTMLRFMVEKMGRSDSRKKLVVNVPDGNWGLLKFLMSNPYTGDTKKGMGFKVKLVPDFDPEGYDVWRAEYSLPAQEPSRPEPVGN